MTEKCRHTTGIEYDIYETFVLEEDYGTMMDSTDIIWFNYCPMCGVPLKEGKII